MSKNSFSNLKSEYGVAGAIAIWIIAIAIVLGVCFGFMCLEAWITMALWNAIIPYVFATVGPITFWQMFGFDLLLAIILPGGVGSGIAKAINKD